ncbi:MAG: AAA family ATPase [Kordiimonadaceae bacterium]|jgi:general secretion pathway protein A|nr:AAA family ATPase [Kordiimonadaceae bacterium]MBT6031862.1 AAA family ATPase [Kordiimonadaceae bacterium]MBT6330226.1 AAA family ATPase [Kordiimonadaceae bacterium]
MYSEFYNLTGKPFQLTPDPNFYFDSSTHHKAMAYLSYGISQGEGFIIITGEIGSGKTTLVGRLLQSLDPNDFSTAKIVTSQLDADDVLKMVAAAFGINIKDTDKAEMIIEIEKFLRNNSKMGKTTLLLIDEAQNLTTQALEELRMLSNFQDGNKALLQSFLVGQPEFRDKWAFDPALEQLRQRVIATHHLSPMKADETKEYIEHRLTLVNWKGNPTFSEDGYAEIYKYSGGVPRKLNTLCTRILLFGAIEELEVITADVVKEVIEDMEEDNYAASSSARLAHNGGLTAHNTNGINDHSHVISEEAFEEAKEAGMTASAELLKLRKRVVRLEKNIKIHDETIKGTIDIVEDLLDG